MAGEKRLGLSVPAWFFSVTSLAGSVFMAGFLVSAQLEKVRSDLHEQSKTVNQRLCRIEFAVGLVPSRTCDVSEFLVSPDDTRVRKPSIP